MPHWGKEFATKKDEAELYNLTVLSSIMVSKYEAFRLGLNSTISAGVADSFQTSFLVFFLHESIANVNKAIT